MKFTNKLKSILFFTMLIGWMCACSRGPVVQDFAATASPNDEYVKLEKDLGEAFDNQIYILSPQNYKMAQRSLKRAKKSLDKQETPKETLHIIAEGRAYFNRAVEVAKQIHLNLKDVIVARDQAIMASAPNIFPRDFRNADEDFAEATSDVENKDFARALKNKNSLELEYLDLELQSIKQANLRQPRTIIAQAIKEGAKDLAPGSLAAAEKNVQDLEALITINRHDINLIKEGNAKAQKSADHLLKITRTAKAGKKLSPEEIALRMESAQEIVADKQGQIMEKDYQLRNRQKEIVKQDTTIKRLADKNVTLESEKELNRRFEEARNEFSESEAEVYKQGNTLLIRLKGLRFPAAQAALKADNYELLGKVQKVLKNFGKSAVTIEGHTDSTGGKAFNKRLSSERAFAVREYLLSNAAGEITSIKAVGYDYQKPLATNKTDSGREQNRRVDVIINPVGPSEKEFVR